MHIPDGFLSPPVWATLDVLGVPAVAWTAGRAQRDAEDRKIPLMGVMGAFVFAAQMINFPIPLGASGHLVGGALLTGNSSLALFVVAGALLLLIFDGIHNAWDVATYIVVERVLRQDERDETKE